MVEHGVCIPLFNVKLPPQIKRPIHHLILRFLFSIPLDFKFYAGRCGESISQSRPIFTAPSARYMVLTSLSSARPFRVFKKIPSNKVWLGLEAVAPNPPAPLSTEAASNS